MNTPIENAIFQELAHMTPSQQQMVLQYAKTLPKKGARGRDLLDLVGAISSDDLVLMKEAIEAGCEQVDPNEW